MTNSLETGVQNVRNVGRYIFREHSLSLLPGILQHKREIAVGPVLFFIDEYFRDNTDLISDLPDNEADGVIYVATSDEPTTSYINQLHDRVKYDGFSDSIVIVGIGGGITLDVAKAISNLLGNGGRAEDYQGWDLLTKPGVYKIGIPTVSGTGSEATRTCVLTNPETGIKLGMNSDFTVFDELILDSALTRTVPSDQYFFTGMDAYIHCIEALAGSYRNSIGDALSEQSLRLSRQVFLHGNMKSDDNRAKLMVSSYLGGCAIATSYVGLVHPFSAGLSVVLGLHHGVANCIALMALEEFYESAHDELLAMADRQGISIPTGVCAGLTDSEFEQLYSATIVHEKPLTNALGQDFSQILTRDKVLSIFSRM